MKEIITRDGSITYWNEEYNEAYHSKTVGAIEEAMIKYVEPGKLDDGMVVLDFCFGLGYNTLAAISKVNSLKIIGIENDRMIINKINEINVPKEYAKKYEIVKTVGRMGEYKDKYYDIKLIMGDVCVEIKKLNMKFDAVLFDPFSPGVYPDLWSLEVFQNLAKLMKTKGRLTTYSCAKWIRKNLEDAGFTIVDGPCFGRKSPSTVAIYK